MPRIRTFALALAVVLAGAAAPQDAEAQFKFGVHVASALDFPEYEADLGGSDGAFGLGARAGIGLPALPFSFFGTVDYFFPDCGDYDCAYQNFAVDVNLSPFPFPMVDVYGTGGIVIRRYSLEGSGSAGTVDTSETATGFSIGAGVALNFLASAYLEGRYEIFDEEDGDNQLLIRLGVLF